MQIHWQDLLVAAPVLIAAAYLVRRAWKVLRGTSRAGCGSACGGCSADQAAPQDVVQLELPGRAQRQK
ncbi:MAG TPA: FeoB-associated Cys-rich membrane protein [Pirellulales bacterium]|jgi:hypothetical protein|nr:FeoB-associated Cys-rich membrane protein [Pirellulales bacterium]